MVRLGLKLLLTPALFLLIDYIYGGIFYPSWYQLVMLGLVVAILSYFLEVMFLQRGTLWLSTIMEMIVCLIVVYFSKYVFVGSKVFLDGAFLMAVLFGLLEYMQHIWMLRSGRVEKM
ncbi:DUF2512 family protein [Brevibacillus daliensis]|uniref:DUF2512 family protein n=1 Tax=Brevibacillus daliensis TaxID=2892995 RepID=UPI001E4371CE|nr:DUF2512 family protein [Brevibacillus daliensis]